MLAGRVQPSPPSRVTGHRSDPERERRRSQDHPSESSVASGGVHIGERRPSQGFPRSGRRVESLTVGLGHDDEILDPDPVLPFQVNPGLYAEHHPRF